MGISVFWDNEEHTIICQSFVSTWTWAEYDASIDQIYERIRQEKHIVHVIADVRHTAPQLAGPAWRSYSRALRNLPPNTGFLIACGKGHFTTAFFLKLSQTFSKAAPRTRQVNTLDEAYQLIRSSEPPADAQVDG